MNEVVKHHLVSPNLNSVFPHLSLFYRTLSGVQQKEIARELIQPLTVRFNLVSAVSSQAPTTYREDVESWREMGRRKLER